jgi:uncharacterized tellurite resistance protein B-like protein
MRPITPEQHAKCYGTFIANLNVASITFPTIKKWFESAFPEINTMYKLNQTLFLAYPATLKKLSTLPKRAKEPSAGDYAFAAKLREFTPQLRSSLVQAMVQAEVDPTISATKVKSFNTAWGGATKNYSFK